ncbi:hypothetical protein PN36_31730 [Candidatus Thiomargarita nelsonii]|uniref:Uncharacterized protein n=1 Tax=Candidatus Thiomargarita nelsonii TaxID=1003181 RepID=A0A0A6PAL2_9GAMM|nr:hypothetical protein PN36_31730 [Candidatus Thiomargarita nelsonii]
MFRVYIYDMSWGLFDKARGDGYSRMHCTLRDQTIMKDGTQYAYYILKGRLRIYLCLPPTVPPLKLRDYDNLLMNYREFDASTADTLDLVALFKVALKNFCVKDESDVAFTGKGKIYFPTGEMYKPEDKPGVEHRKVLAITPIHNWRRDRQLVRQSDGEHNTLEILMQDNLGKMRLLSKAALTQKKLQWQTYYRTPNNGQTFIQLIPHDLNNINTINVYEIKGENRAATPSQTTQPKDKDSKEPKRAGRNKIINVSIKSEERLKQSRCYVLNQNLSDVQRYLQNLGIDAEIQVLSFSKVSTGTNKECKNELPFTDYPVTLIDARLNKSIDFEEVVRALRAERGKCQFVVKKKAAMETPGETERFLVIRDYGKAAFEENGPLKEEYGDDPYRDDDKLKAKGVVLKTLVINPQDRKLTNKSADDEDYDIETDEDDDEKKEMQAHFKNSGKYLQYVLPSNETQKKALKRDLTISLSGLHIRDILMRHENIADRFPCDSLMKGLVFLYRQKALFVENGNLHIINLSDSDFDREFHRITERDYDELVEQIDSYYSFDDDKPLNKEQEKEIVKGHQYIIVSKEFVVEITKGNDCRALFDTDIMLQRLLNRTEPKSIKDFMVTTETDDPSVAIWNNFLNKLRRDGTTSACYEDLVKAKTKKSSSTLGGYIELGKTHPNSKSKWDNDLSDYLGIDLRSTKKTVTDWSKGILFDQEKLQYMVGQKNAFKDGQTRSNLIRGIILIDGVFNPDKFFPLLDVSFVRYKQYTVLPFPFKLIEKFIQLEEIGYHS